jgi:hypothetical protein
MGSGGGDSARHGQYYSGAPKTDILRDALRCEVR